LGFGFWVLGFGFWVLGFGKMEEALKIAIHFSLIRFWVLGFGF
jgi:hypothetical protein